MYEKVSEVLEAAAEVVANGWHRGALSDGKGNYCALGAITKTFEAKGWRISNLYTDAEMRLSRVIDFEVDRHSSMAYIAQWNDHPDRTKEEVIDAFILAAKGARNEGL